MTVDKFEEMMQAMQKMSDAEQKAALDGARMKCICMECPTSNDCMKEKNESVVLCNRKNRLYTGKERMHMPGMPGNSYDGA